MTARGTPGRRSAALLASLLAGALLAGCATTGSPSRPLADDDGMTVYTFDQDERGAQESACYGNCAVRWPPVPAESISGESIDAMTRDDGTRQATHDGRPLYYYAGDSEPGDMKGDNVGGVWHAVRRGSENGYNRGTGSGYSY